jgi:hypothetical protein
VDANHRWRAKIFISRHVSQSATPPKKTPTRMPRRCDGDCDCTREDTPAADAGAEAERSAFRAVSCAKEICARGRTEPLVKSDRTLIDILAIWPPGAIAHVPWARQARRGSPSCIVSTHGRMRVYFPWDQPDHTVAGPGLRWCVSGTDPVCIEVRPGPNQTCVHPDHRAARHCGLPAQSSVSYS